MAFRLSGQSPYGVMFRDQDEIHEFIADDVDDGYTCPYCNTNYEKDLQLAAQLGKTLLERNKDLELALRQQQALVDDQAQEIEYLRKQTAALKEVNNSRMQIYEQLEVSIQDLEHANHRLTTQTQADKKHISNLETQLEKVESKLEETERRLEEELAKEKRGIEKPPRTDSSEIASLREELATLRQSSAKHQASVRALQATVDTVTQENLKLEKQVLTLQHKQEEYQLLEQIGRGKVCARCLRSQDDMTSITGDDDSMSIVESIMSSDHYQTIRESIDELGEGMENPFRRLIEQYEMMVSLRREAPRFTRSHQEPVAPQPQPMSLQDELKLSGEFSTFTRDIEEDIEEPSTRPPDYSETSSGFSDETINKGTQTEGIPGAFLCSITDGDDCKFSIYDEANQVESRFRKTPEYRKLFREIFDVLKREAEKKDEGETLPLLEDMTPVVEDPPQVPPQTPARESEPQELAFASQTTQVPVQEVAASTAATPSVPVKEKKDILETLSMGVGTRKKKGRRHRGSSAEPPPHHSRKKQWYTSDSGRSTPTERPRSARQATANFATSSAVTTNTPPVDFAPPSSASHEVARLKQLEKSYAEVLRMGRQRINRN